jgi:hypothetical protein
MPLKPSWLIHLPEIISQLSELAIPVVDRAVCELVFGVKRRRAHHPNAAIRRLPVREYSSFGSPRTHRKTSSFGSQPRDELGEQAETQPCNSTDRNGTRARGTSYSVAGQQRCSGNRSQGFARWYCARARQTYGQLHHRRRSIRPPLFARTSCRQRFRGTPRHGRAAGMRRAIGPAAPNKPVPDPHIRSSCATTSLRFG